MTGARHVGLSVTDVDRAVWWCTRRLGLGFQEWPAEMTGPRTNFLYDIMEANQGGGRLLVHPETGLCLGLTPATVPGVVAGLPAAALDRLRRGDFATYGNS